jgi:hypothetical protein
VAAEVTVSKEKRKKVSGENEKQQETTKQGQHLFQHDLNTNCNTDIATRSGLKT